MRFYGCWCTLCVLGPQPRLVTVWRYGPARGQLTTYVPTCRGLLPHWCVWPSLVMLVAMLVDSSLIPAIGFSRLLSEDLRAVKRPGEQPCWPTYGSLHVELPQASRRVDRSEGLHKPPNGKWQLHAFWRQRHNMKCHIILGFL